MNKKETMTGKQTEEIETRNKGWMNWRCCLYFDLLNCKSFANDLPIIYQSYFFVMLLIICQSFTNLVPFDYQWFSNAIFMLLKLPIVYQSFAN